MLRAQFERGVAKLRQLLAAFQGRKVDDECRVPEERDECNVECKVECVEPAEAECLERDEVNFPRIVRHEVPPPVRYGVFPESWFTFFYDKTGVTGPYTFAAALSTYLVSKEIYIMEHNYYGGLSMAALCVIGVKKFGKDVAAFCDKDIDKDVAEFQAYRKEMLDFYEDAIDEERVLQWQAMGEKELMGAKRQMVAVQLETEFRKRQMSVYNEVKERLDMEVSLENVRKRVKHNHLRGWLEGVVISAVRADADLQRRILINCIETLKGLRGRDKEGTSAFTESATDEEVPERKITTVNMSSTKLEDAEELVEEEEEKDDLYLS